jgi:hypothetical protein
LPCNESSQLPLLAQSGHAGADELPFFAKSGHSPIEFYGISPALNVHCCLGKNDADREAAAVAKRRRHCIIVLRLAYPRPFIFLMKLLDLPALGCQHSNPKAADPITKCVPDTID